MEGKAVWIFVAVFLAAVIFAVFFGLINRVREGVEATEVRLSTSQIEDAVAKCKAWLYGDFYSVEKMHNTYRVYEAIKPFGSIAECCYEDLEEKTRRCASGESIAGVCSGGQFLPEDQTLESCRKFCMNLIEATENCCSEEKLAGRSLESCILNVLKESGDACNGRVKCT